MFCARNPREAQPVVTFQPILLQQLPYVVRKRLDLHPNRTRKEHDVDRVGEILVEGKGGARADNDDGLAMMQCNYCQPNAYLP